MQKLFRAMHKNEKGFTLVELMVVVVIIGILVAIAIPIFGAITAGAERGAVEANLRTIDGAIMQYRAATGDWPSDYESHIENEYIEPIDSSQNESYDIATRSVGGQNKLVGIVDPEAENLGGFESGTFVGYDFLGNLPWDQ